MERPRFNCSHAVSQESKPKGFSFLIPSKLSKEKVKANLEIVPGARSFLQANAVHRLLEKEGELNAARTNVCERILAKLSSQKTGK